MFNPRAAVPAAATLLALIALPATASAVAPKAGHYAQSRDNVIVATFDVSGGEVRSFSHNDSCARFGVPVPAIRIHGNGRFSCPSQHPQSYDDRESLRRRHEMSPT